MFSQVYAAYVRNYHFTHSPIQKYLSIQLMTASFLSTLKNANFSLQMHSIEQRYSEIEAIASDFALIFFPL